MKEGNKVMKDLGKLRELLLKKEELYNDSSIDDDMYYYLVDKIDDEIVNNFTIQEIEQVEKEIGGK